MSVVTIRMPPRIDQVTSVFALNLPGRNLDDATKCSFDFCDCGFGEPLPLLLLGREIRALVRKYPHVHFTCITSASNFRGYADHIGFFRYAGFARGNLPGEASGSGNNIPIQVIDLEALRAISGDRPYAEIIVEKARELTRVLTQQSDGDAFIAIAYSLREMIRNAIEHSRSRVLVIFGQFWPAIGKAEIVILMPVWALGQHSQSSAACQCRVMAKLSDAHLSRE